MWMLMYAFIIVVVGVVRGSIPVDRIVGIVAVATQRHAAVIESFYGITQ
jgi:hypothetical protein